MPLPPLTLGTWSFGGDEGDYWGVQDQQETERLIRAAIDQNVGCFDTAEMYNSGRSESAIGEILAKDGLRAKSIIISKIPPDGCHAGMLEERLDASLSRLQTDFVDVYMVHWPFKAASCWKGSMPSAKEAFAALAACQKAGKFKELAVSNFGVKQMREALECGVKIAYAELPYAVFMRAIEFEVLDICRENGIGILAYSPLMQGLLTGQYKSADELHFNRTRTRHFRGDRQNSRHKGPGCETEMFKAIEKLKVVSDREGMPLARLCLRWVLSKPGVVSVVAGCRTEQQLKENIESCSAKLSEEVVKEIDSITDEVKTMMGAFTDYYASDDDQRCE